MDTGELKMNCRVVENDSYLSMLRELILEGKEVRLNVRGLSMIPFLFDGRDSVIIEKIEDRLKKGDIVIFQRKNGAYIMHRICRVNKENKQYYLVGDAQKDIEGPIDADQIFGVITKVCRNGKWISKKHIVWWFYDKVWGIMRPFRTKLLLKLLAVRKRLKG